MNKILKAALISAAAIYSGSAIADCGCAHHKEKEFNRFYVGAGGGASIPLKNSFKEEPATFHLKKSEMYTGLVGYKITEDIFFELSYDHKDSYGLRIEIPDVNTANTKAKSSVYMANVVYHLQDFNSFRPYFVVGVGFSDIKVKPIKSNARGSSVEAYSVTPHTSRNFTWQLGLGVSKPVTDNLSLDLSTRMHVAHNLKLKYRAIDKDKLPATVTYKTGSIKKTLGVGEIIAGFTYDLPF